MKKVIKYLTILIVSIFVADYSIVWLGDYYKKDTKIIELSPIDTDCRFFGGSIFQNLACIRNIKDNSKSNLDIELLSVLDAQCKSGNGVSCALFVSIGELYQKTDNIKAPFLDLSKLRENCLLSNFDKGKTTDYLQRSPNCSIIQKISSVFSSNISKSLATQQLCFNQFSKCTESLKENYLFSLEDNEKLLSSYCGHISNDNLKYCNTLKEILTTQKDFWNKLERTKEHYHFVSNYCLSHQAFCAKIFNEPFYLKNFLKIDPNFNYAFFDKFVLDFSAINFISENTLNSEIKETKNLKHRLLKFLLLAKINKHDQIAKECSSSSNKQYCFAQFTTLDDGIKRLDLVKKLCQSGDSISCDYVKIISNSSYLNLSIKVYLYNYYTLWEATVIAKILENSKMIKLSYFLAKYKFNIIIYLSILSLILSIYILIVFTKFEDIFNYIRKKTIEDIKNKLKLR